MQNILIIEPSTAGLELLPTAHAMGLNVFILTANQDERIIPTSYQKFIFKSVIVDTNNFLAMQEATVELHKKYPLSAIIPGFEIFVAHAARLSCLVGVPGISVETGDALRNKAKMRDALLKNDVRSPNHFLLEEKKDIVKIAEQLKFPCVIKPIDQSGSVHVSKVCNLNELIYAYDALCRDEWTEMGKGVGKVAIVEEYIDGEEFSIEGYVDQHGANIIAITKKFLSQEPFFVEMGHIVQANINEIMRAEIESYVKKVIEALRISLGVFHCEIRVDQQGPILMEIAGRLAGDRICNLILLSSGINLYQIMLQSYLGQSIYLDDIALKQYAGIRFFALNEQDKYYHIKGITELQNMSGFQEFKILVGPGQQVPPLRDFTGRVAFCIFTACSYDILQSLLNNAQKNIIFE
ncbi:MAG: ATP-grasp domain-containing protein [Gammaproteobacteria bacterium]|nr:MAG: ATP-grasp domain-containing protein [Gammaproteobacteria bacterium]